ncbi:hypothetical protein DFH09DRAFT_1316018 [Mycena vulgaris]|nr:hypothetical protein DFH09DRAFT_1316018 [Mycena vulgaris]
MSERDIRPLELDSAAFPMLQSATLGCPQGPEPDPHLAHVFGHAPRFRDLRLRFHGEVTLAKFSFPSLQLTKFEGEIHNMELFTLAPNLAETLSVGAADFQFSEWWATLLHLPPTPSASFRDETYFVSAHLRSLTLSNSSEALHYSDLVRFLYRKSGKLRSFQLLWASSPFFDMEAFAGPGVTRRSDTVTGHLARIANAGMDIYIGTAHTNYAQTDRGRTPTPPWSQLKKFYGIIKNLDLFTLASNLTEAECFLTAHPEVSLAAVITHSRLQSLTLRTSPGTTLQSSSNTPLFQLYDL